MTDEWTRAEKRKAQSEQAKAIMKFVGMLSDKISDLEKENAELKGIKDVATLIRANNDTVTTLMQLNNMLVSRNQQLTKAKELLKRCYDNYIHLEPLRSEIEQFLKNNGCPDVMCEDCTKEDCGVRQLGLVEVEK